MKPGVTLTASATLFAAGFFGCATLSQAHDAITTKILWTKEMSRMVFKHCASCHHEGGSAFSLMTYDEARPWAKAIKEEVLARRMPPWSAVKGFGSFQDDRGLTSEDMELISDWVEGGAPEGDPKLLPPKVDVAKWENGDKPAGTTELQVSSGTQLKASAHVVGIRADDMKQGASAQVVAVKPDGGVVPLIWIYPYQPAFSRTYLYTDPLTLPAGSRIEISPADAGTLSLFSGAAVTAHK